MGDSRDVIWVVWSDCESRLWASIKLVAGKMSRAPRDARNMEEATKRVQSAWFGHALLRQSCLQGSAWCVRDSW